MTAVERGLRIERPERLLRDRVTDALRDAIMRGDLEPGRQLTERELGELTGVSRTSLREALRQLEVEGLVEKSDSRGVRVAVLTETRLKELFEVRAVLEPAAVAMFVNNASDEEVAELLGTLEILGGDDEDRLARIRQFYSLLLAGTRNSIMQQMFTSIEARIHALRRLSLRVEGRIAASRKEFDEIARRIKKRDAAAAAEASRLHVLAAKEAALNAARAMDDHSAG